MREVTAVDMRNHAGSPWYDTHGYHEMAADLAEVLHVQSDVIGHSMGGKAAMVLALQYPHLVRRLVVVDIAPVTYSHTQLPMIEAMQSVDLTRIRNRRDADQQLSGQVPDAATRAFLLQSLDVKAKRWQLNLDVLAAEMHKIIGFPEVSGTFEGRTLFLSGAASDYVTAAHRDRIKALFPNANFVKIPKAGHWVHAEQPRALEEVVRVFLTAA